MQWLMPFLAKKRTRIINNGLVSMGANQANQRPPVILKSFFSLNLLIIILLHSTSCKHEPVLMTPVQKKSFGALASNQMVISYLEACSARHPAMDLEVWPMDDSLGFPVVRFSHKDNVGEMPIRIMLLAGQHGNEPSGSEGLLQLIGQMAEGKYDYWLEHAELLILPQCNPYGLQRHVRRNAHNLDLNRDHLILRSVEAQRIQQLFDQFDPHFTADFHEYYPYGPSWERFGYRRNFDIQLGGPTHINTSEEIRYVFAKRLLPYVEKQLKANNFTFFEYTLGHLPSGERMRRSTTNINDGRQSFAITGTFSVIVEGMNGRDSLDRLERRSFSQMLTAIALIKWAVQNRKEVINMVGRSRAELSNLQVPVSIRQEHMPDGSKLLYPLKSSSTGADTLFVVENFHNKVISNLDVLPPKAYLIPRGYPELEQWLERSPFIRTVDSLHDGTIISYRIIGFDESVDEEIPNQRALVVRDTLQSIQPDAYFMIPLNQKYNLRLVLALEPESMYGLINYAGFEPLKKEPHWPVLRLE